MSITTFLERIAKRQSSFVLFGDRVYDILNSRNSLDLMIVNGAKFSLAPSLRYCDFEKLDEITQKNEIEAYCRGFIKRNIDGELTEINDVQREKERVGCLRFIMNEFLPYLLSKNYRTEYVPNERELNADPVEIAKENIKKSLAGEIKHNIKPDDQAEKIKKRLIAKEKEYELQVELARNVTLQQMNLNRVSDSILGKIINNQPLYVHDSAAYQLILGEDNLTFKINGTSFVPNENIKLQNINKLLLDAEESRWRLEALNRNQDIFEEIRDKINQKNTIDGKLIELARLNEYEIGDCGFVRHDGLYYVYSKLPKFATQDSRNPKHYWPFDATRIAIALVYERGKVYSQGSPIAIESRPTHPCLRDRGRTFCEICNLNRDERAYKNNVLDLVRKLSDGCNAFMEPLNSESIRNHPGETYFGDTLNRILTQEPLYREEAIKKGYKIVEVVAKEIGR